MIAQDVEKVFPEWVGTDSEGFKTLSPRGFEALSVEGMRALKKENDDLRSQLTDVETRLKNLEHGPMVVAGFSASSVGGIGAMALALGMLLASRRRSP
jgi:hypothetical protein